MTYKSYKFELWKYDIFDCVEAEEHLNAMADRGIYYCGKVGRTAIYQRRKPGEDVKYSVDLFLSNSEEEKYEYDNMFRDSGWTLCSRDKKSGQSVFFAPKNNRVVSPYTDEETRLEHLISQGVKGSFIDLRFDKHALGIVACALGIILGRKFPLIIGIFLLLGLLIILSAVGINSSCRNVEKAYKSIQMNETLETGKTDFLFSKAIRNLFYWLKIILGIAFVGAIIVCCVNIAGDPSKSIFKKYCTVICGFALLIGAFVVWVNNVYGCIKKDETIIARGSKIESVFQWIITAAYLGMVI